MSDLINRIRNIEPGTSIPRPGGSQWFTVKAWGKRAGQPALVYCIPNHKDPSKPHEKGITESEWNVAHTQLIKDGVLTKQWFREVLPRCDKEGGCNFITIGGIFSLLGIAAYDRRGVYRAIQDHVK